MQWWFGLVRIIVVLTWLVGFYLRFRLITKNNTDWKFGILCEFRYFSDTFLNIFLRMNWSVFAEVIHLITLILIIFLFFIHTFSPLLVDFAELILTSHKLICISFGTIIVLGLSLFLKQAIIPLIEFDIGSPWKCLFGLFLSKSSFSIGLFQLIVLSHLLIVLFTLLDYSLIVFLRHVHFCLTLIHLFLQLL